MTRSTRATLPLVVLTKLHFRVDHTFKYLCAVSIPDPDNRYACQAPDQTPARLFVIPLSADFSVPSPSTLSLGYNGRQRQKTG